ncbi:acetyl-CoA carboxylase biotin carboxyl carrier protein [Helicobacter baculiformis]|uniref:Biotin carboxyl carrier protein of acetyl-CoA carboxylase n=1 Tax=Helicobacter baculiformis TaxID=427351 RepID=A0ABV7ZM94_9HELI|nr:acetyl-CoA carboxylase biotin carboxyl carrier protein [Helicobacter baculiformis]
MKLGDIQEIISSFDKSNVSYMKLKLENLELILDRSAKKSVGLLDAQIPSVVPSPQTSAPLIQSPTASTCALNSTAGVASVSKDAKEDYILSPMVGTFYRCPAPGASPYVNPGDTIKKGQTIGIVEAMKIMNEIEAECDCKVLSIEVEDATAVEFGTQLVKIEKL